MVQRRHVIALGAAALASSLVGRAVNAGPLESDAAQTKNATSRKPRFAISTYSY